ncbi:hypothetical protein EVAR_93590_1 [Eumeta japonica]|uniref:Uncharacterized protein n=1 Tax=Eumeta variegata TaxID=151549 RepID=A0A4C1TQM6_EUMVA|nr:hypothetical protein EVAR_93590_1 [Eumeta japonica]
MTVRSFRLSLGPRGVFKVQVLRSEIKCHERLTRRLYYRHGQLDGSAAMLFPVEPEVRTRIYDSWVAAIDRPRSAPLEISIFLQRV